MKPEDQLISMMEDALKQTSLDNALEAALYLGLAYVGAKEFGDWKGALYGPICLKMATSGSEVAAAAGLVGLVSLGVMAAVPDDWLQQLASFFSAEGGSMAALLNFAGEDAAQSSLTTICEVGFEKWRRGNDRMTAEFICVRTAFAQKYAFNLRLNGWKPANSYPDYGQPPEGAGR